VRVTVTAQDIAGGRRNNGCACPVAAAIMRAMNARWGVIVGPGGPPLPARSLRLPAYVAEAVKRFDEAGEMTPMGFDLET
jgi:hypothetical protein